MVYIQWETLLGISKRDGSRGFTVYNTIAESSANSHKTPRGMPTCTYPCYPYSFQRNNSSPYRPRNTNCLFGGHYHHTSPPGERIHSPCWSDNSTFRCSRRMGASVDMLLRNVALLKSMSGGGRLTSYYVD